MIISFVDLRDGFTLRLPTRGIAADNDHALTVIDRSALP
jgi:hypothetical protein